MHIWHPASAESLRLFFSRRVAHKLVKEVYDLGLIDDKQAFSR